MAEWARALSEGIGAAANTGANIIGDQMAMQRQVDAEQRAADIKLDLAQRMAASEEMMKNRAAERFSSVVKQKMGEEVPVDAAPVAQTGITRAAGQAAGAVDVGGTQVSGSFNADPATLKQMLANAQQRLTDPASTAEQRTQAKELIATLQAQVGAQADINGAAAAGKTRKRTTDEASQAALDDTLQNDAPAFIAGTGMLSMGNKQDLAEKTLKMREAQVAERLQASQSRTDMMGEIAKMRLEQAEALGGKGGKLPSDAKMIDYLVENGMDRKTATDRVTGTGAGATKDPVAMATSLASSMISSGVITKKKGESENDFLGRAMSAATGQIQSAESMFRPGGAAPAPAPAAAGSTTKNPGLDSRPPLSSFRK